MLDTKNASWNECDCGMMSLSNCLGVSTASLDSFHQELSGRSLYVELDTKLRFHLSEHAITQFQII